MLRQISRSITLAAKDWWRNLGLSLITLTSLLMSLLAINLVLVVNTVTSAALQAIEERVDVSLLFKPAADQKVIGEIRDLVTKMPLVKKMTFFNRDEVLANFRAKHQDNKEILSALSELEENPFGASLLIKAASSRDYEQILKVLNLPEYQQAIEKTTLDDHSLIINRIGLITLRVQKIGLVASLVLLLISWLIVFNTIRVEIYSHREEIGIMKLVGATNWFVRSPFFIEVLINTVLAVGLATLLLYLALWLSQPFVAQLFLGADFSLLNHFNQHWLIYFGGEFIILLILNLASAALAMRRYLKV